MPGTGRPPTTPAYVAAAGCGSAAPAASAFAAAAGAAFQASPGGRVTGEVILARILDSGCARLAAWHTCEGHGASAVAPH